MKSQRSLERLMCCHRVILSYISFRMKRLMLSKKVGSRVASKYKFELSTTDVLDVIISYLKYSGKLYVVSSRLFILDLWGLY